MNIGSLEIDNPFVLAPMAGITDGPFRKICRELGCGLVYSEMISIKGLFYNDVATERLLPIYEEEKPIAYQLFGSDPKLMALATEKLENRQNAVIDINMGCPVPKVVKNGDGSALLNNPKLVYDIVKAVVASTKKPVTAKIRTGWNQQSINAVEIAKIIEAAGASAIGVHGRTREQYYSGKADWETIGKVKQSIAIPVMGSGDVFTGADALAMMDETGCDFVMIARGALGNPWIFREALALWRGEAPPAPPTTGEKMSIANEQLDTLLLEKGEYAAVREMRKHIGWYLKGVYGSAEIRHRINSITNADEMKTVLEVVSNGRSRGPSGLTL